MEKKSWFQRLKFKVVNFFQGITFILLSLGLLWLLLQFVQWRYNFNIIAWYKSLPYIYPFTQYVFNEVAKRTTKGILLLYGLGSMFIFPIPLEMFYLKLLAEGLTSEMLFPLIMLGLFVGHHFNYWTGRLFGPLLKFIMTKGTRKKWKNYLDKYGGFVIIFFNALPLPSPLFNFFTGLFRYKYLKWLFFVAIGQIINYTILTFVYIFVLK